jgi:hypothetical protein
LKEEVLQYIWQHNLYNFRGIKTTEGENIQVLSTGQLNKNSGPDFFNAKVKLGNTLWAGNVEIHIKYSDWNKHGHQHDKAYENVILHVVYKNDCKNKKGNNIPIFELKNHISLSFLEKYQNLLKKQSWVACDALINRVTWLNRIAIERLELKTEAIKNTLDKNKGNWEKTFYQTVAKSFGLNINNEAFMLLTNSLELTLLAKHKNSIFQIEALIFGQAGLLDKKYNNDYPTNLLKEYNFLKHKYKLQPIKTEIWKIKTF